MAVYDLDGYSRNKNKLNSWVVMHHGGRRVEEVHHGTCVYVVYVGPCPSDKRANGDGIVGEVRD